MNSCFDFIQSVRAVPGGFGAWQSGCLFPGSCCHAGCPRLFFSGHPFRLNPGQSDRIRVPSRPQPNQTRSNQIKP